MNSERKRAQNLRYYYKYREREKAKYRKRYHADLERNRARARASMFKQRYGITEAERDKILARQNGACAICKRKKPHGGGWAGWPLDHCHDTNKVRGILCRKCNIGLGHFNHYKSILRAAAKFIAGATPAKPKSD